MASDHCLVLFTKPAIAGRVKTRLIGELSAEQAAHLHAAFVDDLLERLRRGPYDLQIAWAMDQAAELPETAVPGLRQRGADLGERLFHGLGACAAEHDVVAAIGSDHPDLPLSRVEQAFDRVAGGAPVVLGPAEDGGYYLIALRADLLRRELFADIDWSTSRVLEQTVERCQAAGLEPSLLEPWADVDEPADLHRLAARLAASMAADGACCPRTRDLLESWGRL